MVKTRKYRNKTKKRGGGNIMAGAAAYMIANIGYQGARGTAKLIKQGVNKWNKTAYNNYNVTRRYYSSNYYKKDNISELKKIIREIVLERMKIKKLYQYNYYGKNANNNSNMNDKIKILYNKISNITIYKGFIYEMILKYTKYIEDINKLCKTQNSNELLVTLRYYQATLTEYDNLLFTISIKSPLQNIEFITKMIDYYSNLIKNVESLKNKCKNKKFVFGDDYIYDYYKSKQTIYRVILEKIKILKNTINQEQLSKTYVTIEPHDVTSEPQIETLSEIEEAQKRILEIKAKVEKRRLNAAKNEEEKNKKAEEESKADPNGTKPANETELERHLLRIYN